MSHCMCNLRTDDKHEISQNCEIRRKSPIPEIALALLYCTGRDLVAMARVEAETGLPPP